MINYYYKESFIIGIGAWEVKDHGFFNGIDWDMVAKKQYKPPFEPHVVNETAVKNSSMSRQNLTPEKQSSPQTPNHNQVVVGAIRPSPVTPTHRTPGKRSQNRMVIID